MHVCGRGLNQNWVYEVSWRYEGHLKCQVSFKDSQLRCKYDCMKHNIHDQYKKHHISFSFNVADLYIRWNTSGSQIRRDKSELYFWFLNQNISCGCSEEPSPWDGSFEHPKHMFRQKIIIFSRFLFVLTYRASDYFSRLVGRSEPWSKKWWVISEMIGPSISN